MRGYQHIVAADRRAGRFELRSKLSVSRVGGLLERQNLQGSEYALKLGC